jgi:putative flippase GtrA
MSVQREFAAFATVGAFATATHFACLTLLVEGGALSPVPASCVGALAGALVSYCLNHRYTFRSTQRHTIALPRFLLVAGIAFGLNAALLATLLRWSPLHYLIAQVVTTIVVMTFTFSANRAWSFR